MARTDPPPTSPTSPTSPTPAPAAGARSSRGLWAAVLVLLVPAVVLPLLVWVYDRAEPELYGFPFYYWFQFALIPVAAILTSAAFLLSREADRRDRAAGRKGGWW